MGYRTYVNGVQIFGSNEIYPEWLDFIRSQGIVVDDDGAYNGVITDFMAALSVMESITQRIEENYRKNVNIGSVFDLREDYDFLRKQAAYDPNNEDEFKTSLFDLECNLVMQGYAFLPYALYLACTDKLVEEKHWAYPNHMHCYNLKEPIRVYAN